MARVRKLLGLLFFTFQVSAMVYSNLPREPLYPPQPSLASGLPGLRQAERALVDLRRAADRLPLLEGYVRWLGLEQRWNTFAPVPPVFVSYISVVARDTGGKEEVLWSSAPPDPLGTSTLHPPLAKYLEVLPRPHMTVLQAAFAAFFAETYRRQRGHYPEEILLVEQIWDLPSPRKGLSLASVRPVHRVFFRRPGRLSP